MLNKKFVYNINCADFLIQNGAKCIGTGINSNSHKTYWVFNYMQCQKAYDEWNKYKLKKERDKYYEKENYGKKGIQQERSRFLYI